MTDQPILSRQGQRATDSHERIIDAAAREFVEKGYQGTSINDIIVGADTSRKFFYKRYPSDGKRLIAAEIMKNTLTMDGLVAQPLKSQAIYDIGMILAYRIAHETTPRLLAALKLSFEHGSTDEYGTPWEDWVIFNSTQIAEAQQHHEIRNHIVPEQQARQLPGTWSGLVLTALVLDGGLQNLEEHISRGYKNLLAAIAVPEILVDMDFSVHRGRDLYEAWRAESENQPGPLENREFVTGGN